MDERILRKLYYRILSEAEFDGGVARINIKDLRFLLGRTFRVPRNEQLSVINFLFTAGIFVELGKKSFEVNLFWDNSF